MRQLMKNLFSTVDDAKVQHFHETAKYFCFYFS